MNTLRTNVAPIDRAFAWILQTEGGLVNDPRDPGGVTKFGISKRAYPERDIPNLEPDDAKAIYKRDYWDACRCSDLPEALALAVFDTATNQGVHTAGDLLQRVLGIQPRDGIIGPKTIAAAQAAQATEIVTRLIEARWDRYSNLATAATFLRGWTRRLFRLQAECLWIHMAKEVS